MEGSFGRQAGDDFSLSPLRIIDPITLQDRPVPAREWLWEGWMPMRATTAFYGDGGTGKSLLTMQFMTACAMGLPFLGCPVKQVKVLGVFCEDDDDELHRRQENINRKLDVDFGDAELLKWIPRAGEENLLMTFSSDGRGEPTPFFHQIVEAATEFGAQLVVIDTAADTFGGNENIRIHVRQYISMLNRLAMLIDGAVLLLAHPSQAGRSSGTGDGGSTGWSNSVRSRWYLARDGGDKGEAVDPDLRTLSRMKANYASVGDKVSLKWVDGAFEGDANPITFNEDGTPLDRIDQTNRAFLAGLQELIDKGVDSNIHKGQANYAPKAIHEMTTAGQTFEVPELEAAMKRLMRGADSRIRSVKEGPASRRRSKLIIVAPDIPGV